MSNLANILKAELTRLARKEVRNETAALKKVVAGYRRELAAIKQRVATLERELKAARKGEKKAAVEPAEDLTQRPLRFSAARFAAQRQRLGLSAADFARLLGVSALSVYKWEHGKARPRRKQLEVIAAARKLGKREALAKLEELKGA